MMNELKEKFQILIQRSRDILSELQDGDEIFFDLLQEHLEVRQDTIKQMDLLIKNMEGMDLSADEVESLNSLFGEFSDINQNINSELNNTLTQTRQNLASATKRRQAEDGYHILEKPDITYYQK